MGRWMNLATAADQAARHVFEATALRNTVTRALEKLDREIAQAMATPQQPLLTSLSYQRSLLVARIDVLDARVRELIAVLESIRGIAR